MCMYYLFHDIFVEYYNLQFPKTVICNTSSFCVVSVVVKFAHICIVALNTTTLFPSY